MNERAQSLRLHEEADALSLFGMLLSSGIRISEALCLVGRDTSSKRFREAFQKIHARLIGTTPLREAMEKCEGCFSFFVPTMVKVGLDTGELGKVLEWLSTFIVEMANRAKDDFDPASLSVSEKTAVIVDYKILQVYF